MKNNIKSLPKFFFTLKGAGALLLGGFLPLIVLSFFNVFAIIILKQNFQYEDSFIIISNALMWLGAIFAFDWLICRPQTGQRLNFNFSRKNTITYFLVFPLMLGMMFIAEFVTSQIPTTGRFFGGMYENFSEMMGKLGDDVVLMIIMAVIMAPIFEEIVFRGIIMKGLINKGWNANKAIWFSAVIFGIIHGNPWQLAGAVLLGYVLGLVYYRTKSLLLPILLHAFNNGISTVLIYFGNTESFSEFFNISEYMVLGIGILLFLLFYYWFSYRYKVHHSE